MSDFEPCEARRQLDARIAGLLSQAARRGAIDGASSVPGEAFHARAAADARATVAPLFAAVHADRGLAVARRDAARRRLDELHLIAIGTGWLAPVRRVVRAWIRSRTAARLRCAAVRAAEAEARLELEAAWQSEVATRLIAVYEDASACGRVAAALLAKPPEPPRIAGPADELLERALRRRLDRAEGESS